MKTQKSPKASIRPKPRAQAKAKPAPETQPALEQQTAGVAANDYKTDERSLERAFQIARAALDKKAENLKLLDISKQSTIADYFLICNGMSPRQVQAIADSIQESLKKTGVRASSVEGTSEGRWVLMDFGDVIVHIFLDALREYYDIESLWRDAARVTIPASFYGPGASSTLLN